MLPAVSFNLATVIILFYFSLLIPQRTKSINQIKKKVFFLLFWFVDGVNEGMRAASSIEFLRNSNYGVKGYRF